MGVGTAVHTAGATRGCFASPSIRLATAATAPAPLSAAGTHVVVLQSGTEVLPPHCTGPAAQGHVGLLARCCRRSGSRVRRRPHIIIAVVVAEHGVIG
jgi:hypothetical protein